ncbi:MAG: hypothetical protein JO187_08635 [Acidobacteria bacterium]|nr:hypothetical protein [Acidobacteriota bacterium]
MPTRISEKRTESGNRTIVTRTLESVSVDGNYTPIAVCEDELVKVDANTTRRNTRSYGVNDDGGKFLIETVQEQSKKLANGGEDNVRTVLQNDESGQQRVARREIEKVRPAGANTTESDTTVLLPDVNTGSLAANAMIKEVRRQQSPNVEQVHRTQLLPNGNGGWQTGEVRDEVVRIDANGNRTIEHEVSAPDANGKLSPTERTVTRDTKNGPVETRQVDRYVPSISGTLELDSHMQVVQSTGPGGTQVKSEVDTRNPISTSDSLQPAEVTVQTSTPNAQGGRNVTSSTGIADPNGNMTQVTVSFGQSKKDAKPQPTDTKVEKKPTPSDVKDNAGESKK